MGFRGIVRRMAGGRPTDYDVSFCEKALKLCEQGATVREVAETFDVHIATIYRWQHEHPEFRESLRLGKEAADDRVEHALYQRATGYSFDAIKIMQYEGQVVVEPYVEHVPPDIGAAKFWLTNRRGKEWREKVDHEHNGTVNITVSQSDVGL